MRPVTSLIVVLLLAPFPSVIAQERAPPVKPGARVRVSYTQPCPPEVRCVGSRPAVRHTGTVVALDGDSLVLAVERRTDRLVIPRRSMTKLEVSWGHKRQTVGGAIIGASVTGGLVLGVLLVCGDFCPENPGAAAEVVVYWAAIGAGIGALIGTAVITDRWEEVPLDRLRLSFMPQRKGRFGLSWSVAF